MKATRFDSRQQERYDFLRAQGHTALAAARAARGMIGAAEGRRGPRPQFASPRPPRG